MAKDLVFTGRLTDTEYITAVLSRLNLVPPTNNTELDVALARTYLLARSASRWHLPAERSPSFRIPPRWSVVLQRSVREWMRGRRGGGYDWARLGS